MCLAVPGKIIEISEGEFPFLRKGKIDFGGVYKEVSLAYLPEAVLGDYVLVHVGFALSKIQEEEAQKVFHFLKELGQLEDLQKE